MRLVKNFSEESRCFIDNSVHDDGSTTPRLGAL